MSYSVATGNGRVVRVYRFRWKARRVFDRLPLAPGEAVVLARRRRSGVVEVLDERFGPIAGSVTQHPELEDGSG